MKRLTLLGIGVFLLIFSTVAMSEENTNKLTNHQNNGVMMKGHMGSGMGMMGGGWMGRCMHRRMMFNYIQPGSPEFENYQKFLKEARPTIEELNAKRAELRAIYRMQNPDPKKAGELARKITILEEKLQDLAFKYNLPDPCPHMWRGRHMMRGNWW